MEARINGIKLHYIDTGNPEALPVVLIHGMTFDHRSWNSQIELLKQNYRVIAYDIRGHGKTDVVDGQYTYKMFVDDLITLLDYLEIDKAILCGLSMGGIIAMRTFEKYPDRIKALILCDTRSDADSNETRYWRENSIESIKKEGLGPFADEFIELCAPQEFVKFPEELKIIRKTILSSSPLGICGALLAQAARPDMQYLLPQIDVPTLIMIGENDYLTPLALSKIIHENIPGSELKIISEACHISNLENRDEFNKYLLDFLEKIKL
ncbi:alpha/beta fold hydrolase [Methanobacterium oryzae]|uniref:alpha/beta fold hydrolase n=1 Tax=Methanobacterium oryzae TaxID=69540 RepID=UPI003D22E41B